MTIAHYTILEKSRRVGIKPRLGPLNTGEPVQVCLSDLPALHMDGQGHVISGKQEYLRLYDLPASEHARAVMVAKLEFDEFPLARASILLALQRPSKPLTEKKARDSVINDLQC